VTTAGVTVGLAELAPEVRMWRRAWGGGRLAPVGWPLFLLFIGLPLWWFLGVSAFIAPILALPLALPLVDRRPLVAPSVFGCWLLFLLWSVVTATQLDGARDGAAFLYRLLGYLAATVVFLYVLNAPRGLLSTRTVVKAMAAFWVVVVAGGLLGVALPAVSFTTPTEALLPGSVLQDSFVYDMVHASTSSAKAFAAYPIFRPKAPLPYTNMWASVYALTLPFAFSVISMARRPGWRWMWISLIAISLVPFIFSLSRGAWLSVAVAAMYAVFRLLGRGRLRTFVGAVAILGLAAGLLAFTPLGEIILVRFEAGYSNEGRLNIYLESLRLAQASPLFGYGAPVSVPGLPSAGTHGQIWTVLVSHGLPGTVFFLGAMLWMAWRSGRAVWSSGVRGTTVRFWSHLVIVIALVQLPFYALLPWGLVIVMLAAGLFWRELLLDETRVTSTRRWGTWEEPRGWSLPAPVEPVRWAGPGQGLGTTPSVPVGLPGGGSRAVPASSIPAPPVITSPSPRPVDAAAGVATPATTGSRHAASPWRRRWPGIAAAVLVTASMVLLLARSRPDPVSHPGRSAASPERAGADAEPRVPAVGVVADPGPRAGIEYFVMPDLIGLPFADAVRQLEGLGLRAGRRVIAEGQPGIVVATDPALGRLVAAGSLITLYVGG
jgi:polysaccharide biosynthesis protein PslJ